MMSSAGLLNQLYNAQTKERIDVVVAAANRWLASHPHDEDVRLARDQAKRTSPRCPAEWPLSLRNYVYQASRE